MSSDTIKRSARARAALPIHDQLWKENFDIVKSIMSLRFVRAMRDGKLHRDLFHFYIQQDVLFLADYALAATLAASRCTRRPTLRSLLRKQAAGARTEIKRLSALSGRGGTHVYAHPSVKCFGDFLIRTAACEPVHLFVVAITPCLRLYAHIGCQLASAAGRKLTKHPYQQWIEIHASAELAQLTREWEEQLDLVASLSDATRSTYRYAMHCEREFFRALTNEQATRYGVLVKV